MPKKVNKKKADKPADDKVPEDKTKKTIDDVAKDLKRENEDLEDLEFQDTVEDYEGNTIFVSPYLKVGGKVKRDDNGAPLLNNTGKYMTLAQRLITEHNSVAFKGGSLSGPGFALKCARSLRVNLSTLGIATTWSIDPRIGITKINFEDGSDAIVTSITVIVTKV